MSDEFMVRDSGERRTFDSGMVRDTDDSKTDWSLVYDGPLLARWAEHLTKGASKYSARNWMQAEGQAELDRFRASAARHFAQWMAGERDEDHAAAVVFNMNGAEYVRDRMQSRDLGSEEEQGPEGEDLALYLDEDSHCVVDQTLNVPDFGGVLTARYPHSHTCRCKCG